MVVVSLGMLIPSPLLHHTVFGDDLTGIGNPFSMGSPSSPTPLLSTPDVSGDTWRLVDEGASWLRYQSDQHPQSFYVTSQIGKRVYDSGWQDYVYADMGSYYQVQTSVVELRIYDYYVEYWRDDFTDKIVEEEQWFLEYWRSQGGGSWVTCDLYNPTFLTPVVDDSGVRITQVWMTDYPIEGENGFNITWWIKPCGAVKHSFTVMNKGYDMNEFRIRQAWSGITTDYVRIFDGVDWTEGPVTEMTEVSGYIFDWQRLEPQWEQVGETFSHTEWDDADQKWYDVYTPVFDWVDYPVESVLYEDQWQAFDVLARTILDTHVMGSKIDFYFENSTLLTLDVGASYTIDPSTSTMTANADYFVEGNEAAGDYTDTLTSNNQYHRIDPDLFAGPVYRANWIYRFGAGGFGSESDITGIDFDMEGYIENPVSEEIQAELRDCYDDAWTTFSTETYSTSEQVLDFDDITSDCWQYFDKDKEAYVKLSWSSGDDDDFFVDHVYLTISYTTYSGWADTNYRYKQRIEIAGSSDGDFTNYEVRFVVHRSAGASSGEDIYVGANGCESDYDDIRFYNKGDTAALDYWITDDVNSSIAQIWVEVDRIRKPDWTSSTPNDGGVISLYYGYSGASAVSNGDNTFDFFDDFNDGNGLGDFNTAKWTQGTGATWGGNVYEDNGLIWMNDTSKRTTFFSNTAYGDNYAVGGRVYFRDVRMMGWQINTTYGAPDGTKDSAYLRTETSDKYICENDGVGTTLVVALDEQVWLDYESCGDIGAHFRAKINFDTLCTDTTDIPDGTPNNKVFYYIYNGDANELLYIDWTYVRTYTQNEPTYDDYGSEQEYNYTPTNDGCVLTNPTDTDNMYAHYVEYIFTVNVSDADGAADIDYVDLTLVNDTGDVWQVRFDEDTAIFSTNKGDNYIDLDTSGSSNVTSGNDLDITFLLNITWLHFDDSDLDLNVYTADTQAFADDDDYDLNYDVETRLDITGLTVNDGTGTVDRGPTSGTFYVSGTVVYFGSSTNPDDNWDIIDAKTSGINDGDATDTALSSGVFNITCVADNIVVQDSFNVIIVENGGVTDLCHATHSDTYISDEMHLIQLENKWILSTDNRTDVGSSVTLTIGIQYEYDNAWVTTGTVTLSGESCTLNGGTNRWEATPSEASVTLNTYDTVVCTGDAHGLSSDVDEYSQSIDIVWDRVVVTITNTNYWKLPLGLNASQQNSFVTYTAIYDYDDAVFDGTVNLNDTDFAHSTAGSYGYSASSASGGTHGITVVSSNEITIIWQTVTINWSHFWSQYESDAFAHVDAVGMTWSVEGGWLTATADVKFYRNNTLFYTGNPSNGQVTDIVLQFDATWKVVVFTVKVNYTTAPYYFSDYLIKTVTDDVPSWHTLYVEVFSMEIDDYYINIYWETNWHNSTCFIFKDDVYQSNVSTEGFAQIGKPTTGGSYEYTFLFNASASMLWSDQNSSLSDGDNWAVRVRNVDISVTAYIVLVDGYGQVIEQERFEIYVDNVLLNPYEPFYVCTSSTANVTIYDEYWDEVLYTNSSYPMSARVKIDINCHWMIIINQQDEAVYVDVVHNSVTHRFHVKDRLQLLIFDGTYTAYAYRERDDQGVAILTTSGDWAGYEEVAVTDDYLIITRATAPPQIPTPNFAPMMFLLTLIGVVILFVFLMVLIMAYRGRSGQRRIEEGVFSPPDGVRVRPLGAGRPSKTKRDTRSLEEVEYDQHTEAWERIKREAD